MNTASWPLIGVIPQGSGAKRGFFNHRFAQPGRAPDFQHEMRGYPALISLSRMPRPGIR
jgi:hypothetical protein